MKFRTDFVTNSSSSSFICVKVGGREIIHMDDACYGYYSDAEELGKRIKKAKCKTGADLAAAIRKCVSDGDEEVFEYYPEIEEALEAISQVVDVAELNSMHLQIWWQGWGESAEPEHEGAVSVIGNYKLNLETNRGKYWVDED